MLKKQITWMFVFLGITCLSIGTIISESKTFSLKELIYDFQTLKIGWLILAVLCMFGFIIFEGLALSYLIKGLIGLDRRRESIMYGAADVYFSSITPSASGGQPASAWFMIRDGIPAPQTTVALLMNLILYTYALLLCGAIAVLLRGELFFELPLLCQVLIVTGAIVLVGLGILFELLLRHEVIIEKLGLALITLGAKLHLLHHPDRLRDKLLTSVVQYKDCAQLIKGKSRVLWIAFGFNLLQRLSHSLVTVFLYLANAGKAWRILDIWTVQILTNVGSNTIPVPGAVGVADYLLICGLDLVPDVDNAANLELICRGMSFYICILVSLVIIAVGYIRRTHQKTKER